MSPGGRARDVFVRAAAAKVTGTGRSTKAIAAGVPLAVFAVVVMLVAGIVPTSGMGTPDFPPVEPSEAAGTEIPAGYMDAYRRADEEYRVPWPILAAMGQVLTDHGARSPYDTLQRSDEQRFPVVDPAIAPGTDLGQGGTAGTGAAGCRLRLVGDSLLDGIAQPVTQALAASCAIAGLDAREGRTIAEGTGRLDADPPTDETAVVVVLGTNDLAHGATRAELDRRIDDLLAATAGRPTVWATSAATGLATDAGTLTAALTAAQGRHAHLLSRRLGRLPRRAPRGRRRGLPGRRRRPLHARGLPGHGRLARPPARRPPGPGRRRPGRRRWARPAAAQPHGVHRAVGRGRPGRVALGRPPGRPDGPRSPSGPGPAAPDDARASRFAEEFLPASEEFWHEVVAAAPVVAGDSACLQPDPSMPVPQIIEVVWRCEMLRTPPTVWTPDGTVDGADAQDRLLGEAHVVAATWSDRGPAPCDEAAPYAGVFPLPALAARHPLRPRAEHPHRRPAGPRPGEPPPRPAAGRHRVGAGGRGLGHHGAGPR